MVFTHTDLPEPVAPAISRCGIFARSAIDRLAPRGPCRARSAAPRARCWNSARLDHLAEARPSPASGSAPRRRPRRGPGSARRCGCSARASRARGRSARVAICRTFTPGAGSISNCVTVGPVVRPTSSPSTLKVRSASMSFCARRVQLALVRPRALRGGGGVSRSTGGSSLASYVRRRRGLDSARRRCSLVALRGRLGAALLRAASAPRRPGRLDVVDRPRATREHALRAPASPRAPARARAPGPPACRVRASARGGACSASASTGGSSASGRSAGARAMADEHAHRVPGERRGRERARARAATSDPGADAAEPRAPVGRRRSRPRCPAAALLTRRRSARRSPGRAPIGQQQHEPGQEDQPRAVGARLEPAEQAQRVHAGTQRQQHARPASRSRTTSGAREQRPDAGRRSPARRAGARLREQPSAREQRAGEEDGEQQAARCPTQLRAVRCGTCPTRATAPAPGRAW